MRLSLNTDFSSHPHIRPPTRKSSFYPDSPNVFNPTQVNFRVRKCPKKYVFLKETRLITMRSQPHYFEVVLFGCCVVVVVVDVVFVVVVVLNVDVVV